MASRRLRRAVEEPLRQIVGNASLEGSSVVTKLRGRQRRLWLRRGDGCSHDVIGPVKVVRTALQNAASVSSLMLTTECLVAKRPKDEKAGGGGDGGHAGHGQGDF